jgi:hypothetical protein
MAAWWVAHSGIIRTGPAACAGLRPREQHSPTCTRTVRTGQPHYERCCMQVVKCFVPESGQPG